MGLSPDGVEPGVGFGWASDGRWAWVLDEGGSLRIIPGTGAEVVGHVRSAAFSPSGTHLSVCVARAWPPLIRVLNPLDPAGPGRAGVPGCYPRWSMDGVYVAYRLPGTDPDTYRGHAIGILNTRLNVTFRVRATWPAASATGATYTFASLAAVSADRRSVLLMTPRGGRTRTLVSADILRDLAGGPAAQIVSLAWSVEGDRLAVALDDGEGPGRDGMAVVDPKSGRGTFIPWPRAPAACPGLQAMSSSPNFETAR